MKKLISLFILLSLFSNLVLADCDWKTGITPGPNKTFVYSESCHLAVGQLVQTNKTQAAQIVDLTSAVALKNAALMTSDSRIQLWQTAANDEQTRLTTMTSDQKHDDYLAFGLGVAMTFLAAYAAGQLIHK